MKVHYTHYLKKNIALVFSATAMSFASHAQEMSTFEPSAQNFNMAGTWIYRSLHNNSDINATPEQLRLAVSVIEIPPYTGNKFTGTSTSANWRHIIHGEVMGDRLIMRATQGDETTKGWVYDYQAWIVPKWKNGIGQEVTFTGTVIRVNEHPHRTRGISKAGEVFTIYGVKKQ